MNELGRREAADSTVAMSLYNVLALHGPRTPEAARALASNRFDFHVSVDRARKACRDLERLGLVAQNDVGEVAPLGPPRQPVCSRDRRKGRGWRGWNLRGGSMLREVLS